jgi:hypothetical protein
MSESAAPHTNLLQLWDEDTQTGGVAQEHVEKYQRTGDLEALPLTSGLPSLPAAASSSGFPGAAATAHDVSGIQNILMMLTASIQALNLATQQIIDQNKDAPTAMAALGQTAAIVNNAMQKPKSDDAQKKIPAELEAEFKKIGMNYKKVVRKLDNALKMKKDF